MVRNDKSKISKFIHGFIIFNTKFITTGFLAFRIHIFQMLFNKILKDKGLTEEDVERMN